MLTLPVKKKWFDMILSGEKKEEYREIKPYYISRFKNMFNTAEHVPGSSFLEKLENGNRYQLSVCFRNGYRKDSPSFIAMCTLSAGTGRKEWGAEEGKRYFVLSVHEIVRTRKGERHGKLFNY